MFAGWSKRQRDTVTVQLLGLTVTASPLRKLAPSNGLSMSALSATDAATFFFSTEPSLILSMVKT